MNTPLAKLDSFLSLKKDWDSYGASPIDPKAVAAAKRFLSACQPVPTNDGGVQLEWHLMGQEIEIVFNAKGEIVEVYVEGYMDD